jgi:putative ABC transport system permease protein
VFSGSISFRPALVPITIIASVAVTVLASISPIKSATSIEPALVLKGE